MVAHQGWAAGCFCCLLHIILPGRRAWKHLATPARLLLHFT